MPKQKETNLDPSKSSVIISSSLSPNDHPLIPLFFTLFGYLKTTGDFTPNLPVTNKNARLQVQSERLLWWGWFLNTPSQHGDTHILPQAIWNHILDLLF